MTFNDTEQRMHTALLAAAELVNATARVGCGPPVLAKKHAPSMAALERLTRELGALGYVEPEGPIRHKRRLDYGA